MNLVSLLILTMLIVTPSIAMLCLVITLTRRFWINIYAWWINLSITSKSLIMLVGIVGIVGLYALLLILINWPLNDVSITKSGVFGDSFGVLSSLFSGLAFGGLIWTILLQRQDLQITKEEVVENRKILARQNFENTFFNLLQMHHRIVEGIDIEQTSKPIVTGRDCFRTINRDMVELFKTYQNDNIIKDEVQNAIFAYQDLHKAWRQDLEHYFRNLYNIVKYIDEANLDDDTCINKNEKQRYANILAAQLSTYELILLFYNGLSQYGKKRAKALIERYSLLENMDEEEIVSYKIIDCYNKEAYGTKPPKALRPSA